MKKSKSMIENGNVYSGDDEGFESSPEKVCNKSNINIYTRSLIPQESIVCKAFILRPIFKVNGSGSPEKETEIEQTMEDDAANNEAPAPVRMHLLSIKYTNKYFKDEEKLALFRSSTYFRVEVSIICGRELIAMDRGGTSDPYVMIRQDGEQLYKCSEKKKTVNPVWNDQSNVCTESVFSPLVYEVQMSYHASCDKTINVKCQCRQGL